MANAKSKAESRKTTTPILEWVLGGIGVILVIASVAFLVTEGLNGDESPGALSAQVKDIISSNGMHIVTFEVHNSGSQTLSNVFLTARLSNGDREIERAQTVIDYLPGRSNQEGGFYFENDPRAHELQIRPEGYQKP